MARSPSRCSRRRVAREPAPPALQAECNQARRQLSADRAPERNPAHGTGVGSHGLVGPGRGRPRRSVVGRERNTAPGAFGLSVGNGMPSPGAFDMASASGCSVSAARAFVCGRPPQRRAPGRRRDATASVLTKGAAGFGSASVTLRHVLGRPPRPPTDKSPSRRGTASILRCRSERLGRPRPGPRARVLRSRIDKRNPGAICHGPGIRRDRGSTPSAELISFPPEEAPLGCQ